MVRCALLQRYNVGPATFGFCRLYVRLLRLPIARERNSRNRLVAAQLGFRRRWARSHQKPTLEDTDSSRGAMWVSDPDDGPPQPVFAED